MGLPRRSGALQATERSRENTPLTGFARLFRSLSGLTNRLVTYTCFRWLLRIMLGFAIFQVCVQWIVTPYYVITLPPQDVLPPHTYYLKDFSFYYVAAFALRVNPHANLYDPQVLPSVAHTYHLYYDVAQGRFDYPLLLPILLIPLALLSFQVAARIWFFFNLLLWILNTTLIIAWLRRGLLGITATSRDGARTKLSTSESAPKSKKWENFGNQLQDRWSDLSRDLSNASQFALVFGLLVCLSYAPMIEAQALGQATMLMLACFLLAPWLVQRGYPEIAGFLLTVAVLIKIFPIILIAYYLFQRRWRVVFGAMTSFVLLLAAMAMVVGIPGILSMIGILSAVSTTQLSAVLNESLAHVPTWIAIEFGGGSNMVTGVIGDLLIAVIAIGFVLGILVKNWRVRNEADKHNVSNDRDNDDYLGYSWALCTMLLVTPISQEHYDIWLLPAILFCLGYIVPRVGKNLRDATGQVKLELMLALGVIVALVITFENLPFNYDGTLSPNIGPYIMGHPLRPVFMLLRPIGALIVWLVAGLLILRPRIAAHLPQPGNLITPILIEEPTERLQRLSASRGITDGQVNHETDRLVPLPIPEGVSWRYLYGILLSFLGLMLAMRLIVQIVINVAVATPN